MASVPTQNASRPFIIKKNPHVSREQASDAFKLKSENKSPLSAAQMREVKKFLIKKKKLEIVQKQFGQDSQKMHKTFLE